MKSIGIDIGTTTICAVVLERSADGKDWELREAQTRANKSALSGGPAWEKAQDPGAIVAEATALYRELLGRHGPVDRVGLTGQMHGMLYVDAEGQAVGPLYTWQDGRGGESAGGGLSYAAAMSKKTGYRLATGFGTVTHKYNSDKGLVPKAAVGFCTIQAYLGMRLSGRETPLLHASDAASFGAYDLKAHRFDAAALGACGLDPAFFPAVTSRMETLGATPEGIPVLVAVGDNQASFAGSVPHPEDTLLLNLGTGGQTSAFVPSYPEAADALPESIELRPYVDGGYLLVGSPLCGGRAYAALEKFFSAVYQGASDWARDKARKEGRPVPEAVPAPALYGWMDLMAEQALSLENPLAVSTRFSGTRANPDERGGVAGLGLENFTPAHFVQGVLYGLVSDLKGYYLAMSPCLAAKPVRISAAGNAIRLNPALPRIMAEEFGAPVELPAWKEEAACGAALLALTGR